MYPPRRRRGPSRVLGIVKPAPTRRWSTTCLSAPPGSTDEVYFSVIQRKLLTPDYFEDLDELAARQTPSARTDEHPGPTGLTLRGGDLRGYQAGVKAGPADLR
jgi:hypothetical protein